MRSLRKTAGLANGKAALARLEKYAGREREADNCRELQLVAAAPP
jgi:hypothetical protein